MSFSFPSTDYYKRMEERKAKLLAQEPTEYANGPVYSEDTERYYPDLDTCVEEYWDDSRTYEDALVFECYTEQAYTPDLEEYVTERWYEEIEDGYDMDMPPAAVKILRDAQEAVAKFAPTVWYPDYKRRLVFDYSGFPDPEDGEWEKRSV